MGDTMTARGTSVLWMIILSAVVLLAGDQDGKQVASRGIRVVVSLPPVVFEGVPCLAAIEISNQTVKTPLPTTEELLQLDSEQQVAFIRQDVLSRYAIPEFDLLSQHAPPISVDVFDAGSGERMIHVVPGFSSFYLADWMTISTESGSPNRERFKRPRLSVASGEQRILFTDLSPFLCGLEAGKYELTIVVYDDWNAEGWEAESVQFQLATIDGGTRATLGDLIPFSKSDDRVSLSQLAQWLSYDVNIGRLQERLPRDVFDQITPYLFLNGTARTGVAVLGPIDLFNSFPSHLQSLGAVCRYEVAASSGDDANAMTIRARTLAEFPGLEWQLDRVDEDQGLITEAIRIAQQPARDR